MKFLLRQHFRLESARYLPALPADHPCARVHGHSFTVIVSLVGHQDPQLGWVIDYGEVTRRLQPLLDQLDHRLLNEVPGLENPTSENLAAWFFTRAQALLPEVHQITVQETPHTECIFPWQPL